MDSANHFLVVASGDLIGVHTAIFAYGRKEARTRVPPTCLSVDEALNLAAWLVAVAGAIDDNALARFENLFREVASR